VPLQVEHIVRLRVPFFPPSAVISMRVYERAVAIIHQGEASWRHICDAGEARTRQDNSRRKTPVFVLTENTDERVWDREKGPSGN
jgi:hypothetical protein